MKRFETITTLEKKEKWQLARSLNINKRTVADWFHRAHPKDMRDKLPGERE